MLPTLAGRIAIPIHNPSGEVVAYAGRLIGEPSDENPKYKLPPGFKKSQELFNIDRASKEPPEKPLVIVQGFFMDEIKGFSFSPDAIANYLKSSNETAAQKERVLAVQREELRHVQKEIQRTYDLYQQEKLDADGFSKFYEPLNERQKQIQAAIPSLEAELDMMKVNSLSAEEVATQAGNLYEHWQTMQADEKRELIEIVTDKIVVGKEEITINLCYAPSCEEMAKRWRKGWDSNPR